MDNIYLCTPIKKPIQNIAGRTFTEDKGPKPHFNRLVNHNLHGMLTFESYHAFINS